jgi:membrane fusion protein, multidrug efflux system
LNLTLIFIWVCFGSNMENSNLSEPVDQFAEAEDSKIQVRESESSAITAVESDISPVTENKSGVASFPQILPKLVAGVLLGSVAIASTIYAYRWWQFSQYHQQTDNAFVSAEIYPVTSRLGGTVTEVLVKDSQTVNPGAPLLQLDSRESLVQLVQAKAALDVAKQQAEVTKNNIDLVRSSNQPIVGSISGDDGKPLNLPIIPANNKQIEISRQQYKAALATIAQKQAEVKQAELKLSYSKVTALVPGEVNNENLRIGQQVQPGQTLMEIVQPNSWIVANFRENQLEKIQPGQKAEIQIAAFPSRKFVGNVESVFSSPTIQSTPNAADNKIDNIANTSVSNDRRIPVKITFEPNSLGDFQARIHPGMSAKVIINTK